MYKFAICQFLKSSLQKGYRIWPVFKRQIWHVLNRQTDAQAYIHSQTRTESKGSSLLPLVSPSIWWFQPKKFRQHYILIVPVLGTWDKKCDCLSGRFIMDPDKRNGTLMVNVITLIWHQKILIIYLAFYGAGFSKELREIWYLWRNNAEHDLMFSSVSQSGRFKEILLPICIRRAKPTWEIIGNTTMFIRLDKAYLRQIKFWTNVQAGCLFK